MTSPNAYNQLGLGTTQLYNKRVVYNQKRHGTFPLGNRMVTFERRMNVPRQLSPEFLLVDLVNELGDLAEDQDAVLSAFAKKPKRWTRKSSRGRFRSMANTRRRRGFRRCCNMPDSFLHERSDFKALVATVADSEKINDPALVEKDYWIMHAVFGLKQLGLTFELKGGTSLSKGFGIIQRFSEDIDIRIESFDGLQVDTNPNHEKPLHIESRRVFYEKLRDKIKISGIKSVERDTTYDDETLRNAGLRLTYETHFGSIAGLKDGILLEVGFDQTAPNRAVTISSWIVQFAEAKKLQYTDNRALDTRCYNPEYTFVEKVQAVVRKYGQFKGTGKVPTNFLRHYYDIHQLLDVDAVQKFIGAPEYLEHKKKRFKSLDHDVAKSGAFTIENGNIRKQFKRSTQRRLRFTIAARFLWTKSSPAFRRTLRVSSASGYRIL